MGEVWLLGVGWVGRGAVHGLVAREMGSGLDIYEWVEVNE